MINKLLVLTALFAVASFAEDSNQLLTVDHYVRVKSTVPSLAGQTTQIYVRERSKAGTALRTSNLADRVVLFVHGAGTPAEVAFDVPYGDYSWMGFLANAGFDVFSMDTTGYGRSTRPASMNDPCNLAQDQQKTFVPGFIPAVCAPSYPRNVTTIASDWNDIDAVVDYIRTARHVDGVCPSCAGVRPHRSNRGAGNGSRRRHRDGYSIERRIHCKLGSASRMCGAV
jgi:hypothetical protein